MRLSSEDAAEKGALSKTRREPGSQCPRAVGVLQARVTLGWHVLSWTVAPRAFFYLSQKIFWGTSESEPRHDFSPGQQTSTSHHLSRICGALAEKQAGPQARSPSPRATPPAPSLPGTGPGPEEPLGKWWISPSQRLGIILLTFRGQWPGMPSPEPRVREHQMGCQTGV